MSLRRLFLALAAAIFGGRLLLSWMGGAEATSFLSSGSTNIADLALGTGYVMFHLAAVVFVPILVFGTAIDWVWSRRLTRARSGMTLSR